MIDKHEIRYLMKMLQPTVADKAAYCRACRKMFGRIQRYQQGVPRTDHTSSCKSLRKAAKKGCRICAVLVQELLLDDIQIEDFQCMIQYAVGCSQLDLGSREIRFYIMEGNRIALRPAMEVSFRLEPVKLPFKLLEGKTTSELMTSTPLSKNTAEPQTLEMAKAWFDECTTSHSDCSCNDQWSPTRLIDLGVSGNNSELKLILSNIHNVKSQYMTLSYQWSATNNASIKLTENNLEELQRSIPLEQIPQVVLDAIFLARHFGVRYLWVDRLCIIQGSQTDWAKEAAVMGKVYSRSACTIAASDAEKPGQGCFFDRNNCGVTPWKARLKIFNQEVEPFVITPGGKLMVDIPGQEVASWRNNVQSSPLYHRGWVLQESLLSRRILHCTKRQLYWECTEHIASETFPKGFPQIFRVSDSFGHLRRKLALLIQRDINAVKDVSTTEPVEGKVQNEKGSSGFSHREWLTVVEQYSRCGLTHSSDRLVAISSVARLLAESGGDYAAGLWRNHVADGLLWARADQRLAWQFGSQSDEAPSWSWANFNDALDFKMKRIFVGGPADTAFRTVVEVVKFPKEDMKQGQADSCELILNAGLVQVYCGFKDAKNRSAGSRILAVGDDVLVPVEGSVAMPRQDSLVIFDHLFEGIQYSDRTFCMPVLINQFAELWSVQGLLLTPVSGGQFRRLGYFSINGMESNFLEVFNTMQPQQVTIV